MSWEPINLRLLEDRPLVRPTIGSAGLFYPGRRHVLTGPAEVAKTLVAQVTALEEARSGGRVVLFDFETGPWETRDRLRDLGATDEDFARIFYVEPEEPASATAHACPAR